MKFFINNPDEVVTEAIDGLLTNPLLAKLDRFPEVRVVVRKDWDKSKVAVISGGGSGHEPAHAGLVGKGMLTAAVCGDIFASPSVDAVLSAILAVTGDAGSLVIIKNYTGDRINFGLAAEQARALGYKVNTIIVNDDVALGMDVNRRGLVGTLFAQKVAGYMAEAGNSLEEITSAVEAVIRKTYSISLSLTECHRPGQDFEPRLSENQAELGLGIHGEPGIEIIDYAQADQLVSLAVKKLEGFLPDPDARYALIMNNMGGVSPLEMGILVNALRKTALAEKVDYLIGPAPFMTSINMIGFTISLLELNDDTEKALLEPIQPAIWGIYPFAAPAAVSSPQLPEVIQFAPSANLNVEQIIGQAAELLISAEKEINALDARVGDGDAGSTFALMGKQVLAVVQDLPLDHPGHLLLTLGRVLARDTGGSSGVLLSIFFTAAGNDWTNQENLVQALTAGLQKIKDYGGAQTGDRTMIDALEPALMALAGGSTVRQAAEAARAGAESTKTILHTKFGRSSYLGEHSLAGVPDPGAEVVARVFESIALLNQFNI
ncbi:dihydroxyacetone kinase subunit DhaK [Mucilaginibacter sp. CAU 1740]|uniref:dihydroxyacetone kinase subunit DhaK n=1 Tax=Mucilaginibacter sp. CAU 1740 TaxID=3140365 RepID=UPI00325C18FE